ncbi:unnamed protein product, partial [Pylaiella littoralis]
QDNNQNIRAAEALCRQAVRIWELFLWRSHPQLAQGYETLASLIKHQAERLGEAEELLRRALEIRETKLGADVQVAFTLHSLGQCVRQAGRLGEAEELFRRALEIKEAK